jgi:hypothetical protein
LTDQADARWPNGVNAAMYNSTLKKMGPGDAAPAMVNWTSVRGSGTHDESGIHPQPNPCRWLVL